MLTFSISTALLYHRKRLKSSSNGQTPLIIFMKGCGLRVAVRCCCNAPNNLPRLGSAASTGGGGGGEGGGGGGGGEGEGEGEEGRGRGGEGGEEDGEEG